MSVRTSSKKYHNVKNEHQANCSKFRYNTENYTQLSSIINPIIIKLTKEEDSAGMGNLGLLLPFIFVVCFSFRKWQLCCYEDCVLFAMSILQVVLAIIFTAITTCVATLREDMAMIYPLEKEVIK